MSESSTGIAEPETTAENTNMSMTDYQASRTRQLQERAQPQEEAQSTETEEVEEVPEVEETVIAEETPEEVPETEDVLSQFDLDNLSEEDANKISEILKSRAAGRIGALTGKNKTLQEELDNLKASMNKTSPLDALPEIKDNPFSDLKDSKAIQEKAIEIRGAIKYLEGVMYDASDHSPDDIVADVDGQQYTKSQIRDQLLQAQESRDTFLPDQYKKIQEKEQSMVTRRQFGEKAMKELDWMKDPKSPVAQQFVELVSNDSVKKICDENPSFAYLFAHAVNSMNASPAPKKTVKAGKAFDIAPPKSPDSAAAPTERSESRSTKVLSDLNDRFKESGSKDDFIKMRMQQRANSGKT